MKPILRQGAEGARTSEIHAFIPHEFISFGLPARRTTEARWTRYNGDYTFTVGAGTILDSTGKTITELPSGKYARAALLYLCTEAKLTGKSTLQIAHGHRSVVKSFGMEWQGIDRGKEAIRQLMLVAAATFTISRRVYDLTTGEERYQDEAARFSQSMDLWTTRNRSEFSEIRESTITLSPMVIEMMERAVPINQVAWKWLLGNTKSPMALDVYLWLCGRLWRCEGASRITWQQIYEQFGSIAPMKKFKQTFREALGTALLVYSEAQIREETGISRTRGFKGYMIAPSPDPRDSIIPNLN